MSNQVVQVKSATVSKINWTAVLTALLGLATAFGLPISDEMKVNLMALIGTVGPAVIVVLKTYFTKSITPASAEKLTAPGQTKK